VEDSVYALQGFANNRWIAKIAGDRSRLHCRVVGAVWMNTPARQDTDFAACADKFPDEVRPYKASASSYQAPVGLG
jgi:hypothetical protein